MFSFSLFLQNGTSPGILDKDDKVCSLLACFFMLHFLPSQAFPTPFLGTMRNIRTPFDAPHSWEPWETPKTLLMLHFGLPNHSYNTLGNHEKHPPPFSCFIFMDCSWEPWETPKLFSCFMFGLSKPFPPHSWEPWSTQTLFHASFLAFPSPSHPTLGNHEKHPNPLPIPLLGAMKHPNHFSCFILAFPSPSHPTLGNHEPRFDALDSSHPTLGNHEKHPPPFSCFIFSFPKPLSLLETMRNTQTPFHASFLAFPNSSHPTLGNHEKYPPPFSCFIFMDCSWEPWETPKLFSCFMFGLSKPFPPHSWEPWSTQTLFHASFLAFPSPSHPTLGNHEARNPFFMLHFWPSQTISHNTLGNHFEPSQALPTPLLWAMKQPTPVFMLHFWPPQTIPTTLLGTMKHPNFSFGLFLHTGISPGILDKNDKACALSACFLQNGISAGILDKARSLSASLAKRHFTRHTWQSTFSFSLSCKTAFHQAYFTQCVLFQLACAKRISLGLLDIEFTTWTLAFVPPFSGTCIAYTYIYIYTHVYTYIHTYIHYITLHYITLHYITLHYITLHYITLHYITLHYIHIFLYAHIFYIHNLHSFNRRWIHAWYPRGNGQWILQLYSPSVDIGSTSAFIDLGRLAGCGGIGCRQIT